MKECTILCFLFLLFVSFNDGHTLARIELKNKTDVYEVNEGQSTLTITQPKDKTILREIVYFHVIEKPYDQQDEVAKTTELNTRSFTNGHGFQYVDGNYDVIDNAERGNDDEPTVDEQDETLDQDNDGDENETEETTESTEQEEYENDENETSAENTTKDIDGEITNDVNDKEIANIDTDIPKGDVENKEPDNVDARFGGLDNTPDNETIQVKSESRRKREVDYRNLPDAPELPDFNLDILPDYIKAIIFADQNKNNEKENIDDEIEKQVQELERAVNHPPSVEEQKDKKNARTFGKVEKKNDKINARMIGNSLDIDRKDGQNEATYGMSLAGNSGKVWNNINTHHLHYVSEPESHTNIPILDITVSTKASIATDEPSESSYEDIRVNNDFNKPENLNNDLNDFEDFLDEANKQLDELIQNEDETIAPDNNIEDSYIAEQPTVIKNNASKKREVGNGSIEDDKKGSQKRDVRTYGMSLAGDSGVVWNDVNTHISYHVGEPDTIKSTTSVPEGVTVSTTKATTTVTIDKHNDDSKESKENDLEELKDIEESLDQINKMLEELINSTKEANPSADKSTNTTHDNGNGDSSEKKDDKDSDLKTIEDSFDEINKLLEELIKNSTSEVTTENNKDTKEPDYENESTTSTTEKASSTESTSEANTTELTTKKSTKDETTDKSTNTLKPDIENPDDNDTETKNKNGTTKHDNEDSKQKQFVRELMKNTFFWQWLQDSSAAYLEVMMKKLDELIKAEVGKQIKQYFEEHKNVTNGKKENKETNNNTSEMPVESNNTTDTIVSTDKPVEPNLDVNQNSTTENPVVNKEQNKELNNTIDKTENNNSTEDDLARRQNKDSNNKTDASVKIEAKNVYGNSVGNGKVTNIFIFNISKESDLEKIKPLSNGTNGVFVFGLDDKTDEEKVKEQNKTDDEKSNVTSKPETTNKDKDQVSTEKPDMVTPTDEPKDNINSTPENTVEDKQTTTTESTKTTSFTNVDEVSSTTEKVLEATTVAKESENSKDKTDSDEANDIKTESLGNDSTTQNNDKPTDTTESPGNDSTTQNNGDDKPTDSTSEVTTTDKTDLTQGHKDDNDKTTTASNKGNADTHDKIETTDNANAREKEIEVTTEGTKSNEVTTDEIIVESTTGKDKSEEHEIDHNE